MKKQQSYSAVEPDSLVIVDRRQTTNGAIIPNYVVDLYLPIIRYEGLGVLASFYRLAREDTVILGLVRHASAGFIGYKTLQRILDLLEECKIIQVQKPTGRDKATHKRTVIELLDPPLSVPSKFVALVTERTLTPWLIKRGELSSDNSESRSELSDDNSMKLSGNNSMKLSSDNPIHECTLSNETSVNEPPEDSGGKDVRSTRKHTPHATVGHGDELWIAICEICLLAPTPHDLPKPLLDHVTTVYSWLLNRYKDDLLKKHNDEAKVVEVLARWVRGFNAWRRDPKNWDSKSQPYWGGGKIRPLWIQELWEPYRLSIKQAK